MCDPSRLEIRIRTFTSPTVRIAALRLIHTTLLTYSLCSLSCNFISPSTLPITFGHTPNCRPIKQHNYYLFASCRFLPKNPNVQKPDHTYRIKIFLQTRKYWYSFWNTSDHTYRIKILLQHVNTYIGIRILFEIPIATYGRPVVRFFF